MQVNSGNLVAFGRDLKSLFAQQMAEETFSWDPAQIADQESSSAAANEYWWVDSDETMRNWTGKQKEIANLLMRGFLVANQDFERTFSLDLKDLERDEARKVRSLMMALTVPARRWMRQVVSQAILNGGFPNGPDGKPITFTWLDGLAYFAINHLSNINDSKSKQFANLHTGLPLSGAAVITMRQAIMTVPGIGGQPIGMVPKQLWIPPSLFKTAHEIRDAEIISNTTNVLRILGLEVVEIPELEDGTGSYYMAATRNGKRPVTMQIEKQPVFASNAGSLANRLEGEVDSTLLLTEKILAGVSARGNVSLTCPEALHKATP